MSHAVTVADDTASSLLSFIERASRDPEFDVQKFEALLRMQREVLQEQARRAFNQAMAEAQAEMQPVIRDATNTHTSSKYARLETIDREMRPIYTRHGFGVRYGSAPSPRDGWLRIICTVSHVGGYSEVNHLDAPPDAGGAQGRSNKTPVQAVGSSVTYLRRYLLAMVFNIVLADDDDDGEAQRPGARAPQARSPGNTTRLRLDLLDEKNGTLWFKHLQGLLDAAQSISEVVAIGGHRSMVLALRPGGAPQLMQENIRDALRRAHERLTPSSAEAPQDAVDALLGEIDAMDAITLAGLQSNADWRKRVREAVNDFPPDEDRISERIEQRRIALKTEGAT